MTLPDAGEREVRPAKASLTVTPTAFLPLDLAQRILAALDRAKFRAIAAELRERMPK